MKKIIWLLIFLFFYINVWADEGVDLNKIVVTASRTDENINSVSRNIDIITAQDIELSQAKDVAGILGELTSSNIIDYGGIGGAKTVRMRGSTASQVLVMIDGRPINSPRDGQVELASIPLDNISRIEVMHGPGSSLYGSSAMGGTVNIITKKIPKDKFSTELFSSFGTFRSYDERVSHGGRVGNFGYLISTGLQDSQGYRDNSEFNSKNVNAKLEYNINDTNLIGVNSGYYVSRQGAPGSIINVDIDDRQRSTKNYFDLNWKSQIENIVDVSTRFYQNYEKLEFVENSAGSMWDTAGSKNRHATTSRGLDIQLNKEFNEFYQLIGGFNYVGNLNNSSETAKHKYNVRAGYLENKVNFFDQKLHINLGGRVDDYSNFGTQFSPSLSALYALKENVRFHVLVSRSFRAPTFNDLYWPDQGWAIGNPNLKPEKGVTEELGIDIDVNKFYKFGLTYFHNDYKDLINWTENNWVWSPNNVDSAKMDGIEFENKFAITSWLEWGVDYTYLRAKNAKTHKYLVYQPQHKVDSSLKFKDLNGFVAELKGQFTSRRFHDETNSVFVKDFFTVGINVSKRFSTGITCFASVNNIFNKKYQVMKDYSMPGFSFNGGVKVEF